MPRTSRESKDQSDSLLAALPRTLDWLLPAEAFGWSTTELTTCRLLVAFIVVFPLSGLFGYVTVPEIFPPPIQLLMAGTNLLLLGLLLVLRRGLRLDRAANGFLAIFGASLFVAIMLTGGSPMASIYSLLMIPIFALVLTGFRTMLNWTGAALACLVAILTWAPEPMIKYSQAELEAMQLIGTSWVIGLSLLLWLVTEAIRQSTTTDLLKTKEALKAQKNQLRQVIDLVPHFIFAKDREGNLLLANRAQAEAYGMTVEELIGASQRAIHDQSEEVEQMLKDDRAVMDSGKPLFIKQESFTYADGSVHLFETTKIPYTPIGSDTPAILGIAIDITERTESERRMQQAEHLASIGTLSAGIAHQINNPVGAILAAAEYGLIVLKEDEDPQHVDEQFQDIISQARRCGKIVRDVLSFSRISATDKELEDVGLLVIRTVKLVDAYAYEQGATLETGSIETELFAQISTIEIEQVIVNILRNAIDSGAKEVRIECEHSKEEAIVSIRDNGSGIPANQMSKIFDPFFTTRLGEGGSGLGLSVARGIVQGHGGRITVSSNPSGSRFLIHLPLPDGSSRSN